MRTRFALRWRGYDRAAVDQFLEQFGSDYVRLQTNLAYLDELADKKNVKSTLAAAREEADEIRLAAKREGANLIRQAKDRAEQLVRERLKVTQRERDRLAQLSREVAPILESALAVLRKAEERIPSRVPMEHEASDLVESALSAPAPTGTRRSGHSARTLMLIVIALVVVTIPITAAFYAWLGPSSIPTVPSVPVALGQAAAFGPRPDVAASTRDQAGPSSASGAGARSSAPPPASPPSGTAKRGLTIVLRARHACWIRAVLDGQRAAEHLLNAGAEITLQADNEVMLRVGNAGAISMTVNGRETDPLGRLGEVVTRRITRTNDGTSSPR